MEQFSILAAVFLTAFIQTSAHYGCKFYIQYFSLTVHAVCNYSWQPKAKTHLRRKESNVKNHDSITSLLLGFGWWVGAVGRQWQPPDRIVPSNFILNLLRDSRIGNPGKLWGLPYLLFSFGKEEKKPWAWACACLQDLIKLLKPTE